MTTRQSTDIISLYLSFHARVMLYNKSTFVLHETLYKKMENVLLGMIYMIVVMREVQYDLVNECVWLIDK